MNEDHEPASPSDFDKRLKQALARRGGGGSKPSDDSGGSPRSGLSIALRIGIELVAALMVGTGIGILLDRWLGTKPWLMVVFFILGSAAGLLNVMRVTKGMGGTVGYRAPRKAAPVNEDDDED